MQVAAAETVEPAAALPNPVPPLHTLSLPLPLQVQRALWHPCADRNAEHGLNTPKSHRMSH